MAVASKPEVVALDEIREIFGLNELELAALFNVSRSTVVRWRKAEAPAERAANITRVRELARYFHERFIAVRVPLIVRTSDRDLNGKTVLEVIRDSRIEPIYVYLERLFSYSPR